MKIFLLPVAIFAIFAIILSSCKTIAPEQLPDKNQNIRYNQVGYYPHSIKEFVVADYEASSFQILNDRGKIVLEGELIEKGNWEASGEHVLQGDFSILTKAGTFYIQLNTGITTSPFYIVPWVYEAALNASIKSFYFQRASMAIEEQYGGIYKRASGHPDDHCFYHPSTGKEEGLLDSPGGWYDAGDYGKYVVNAAITVGQMLNLLEMVPDAIPTDQLNIPESGNGIRDLLDEIRYELDWVITMQDDDGGVYHKLTALTFGPFIMPEAYDLDRYIIGKGTFSSLTFAAVMAQASRVYADIDPAFSSEALVAAESAWDWAVENSDVPYRNPEDVVTGQYGDDEFSDDFYWAAAELYISTGKENYLDALTQYDQPYIHQITNSWKFFIRNMGFHSLLINDKLTESLTEKHLALSDEILAKIESIPYGISIDHFEWGSNSDVLNQAMILCIAHHLTGEQKYLDGALRNTDYIFGKNATGYSFLTGFGSKQVMFPHHRPSGADAIDEPVPGFILGGPNKDKQDSQHVEYASDYPAKSFVDLQDSYASNEVCLNWNAPAVFVMGYLEQVMR
ncbi:MAG: cellulase [Bacteroidetes bacterium]|nr:MAG: cellulase [Bacteroidota bacterium]RLD91774.1 MAG: cellulase [Bacteroidota bacterium]